MVFRNSVMQTCAGLVLLGLGLAGPLVHGTAWARPAGVDLLESSERGVRFRVVFPDPDWSTAASAGGELRYPAWPDLAVLSRPGEPRTPARILRVALPPEGDVSLTSAPSGGGRAAGVVLPVSPLPGAFDPAFGGYRPARPGLPGTHAEILAVGIERGLRVATLAVYPLRGEGEPGRGDILWAGAVEVRLDWGAPPARGARAPRLDPATRTGWERTLVNPGSVDAFLAQPPAPSALPGAWFDDAPGWLKLRIAANGVYTLTRDSLAAAGVPVAALDPRTLRLFAGPLVPELPWTTLGWDTTVVGTDTTVTPGWRHVYERPGFATGIGEAGGLEEVALWVDGEDDGVFGSADRVVFYALGPDNYRDRFGLPPGTESHFENPYTDETGYWLTWESSLPGSPERMSVVDVTPPANPVPETRAWDRVHAERNTLYLPSLYQPGLRVETWFWDFINSNSSGKFYDVDLPDAVPGENLAARVRLWGGNVPEGTGDLALHHVQIDVNGVDAGLLQWGGGDVYASLAPRDASLAGIPAQASTRFVFRVPSLAPGRFDQVYLAWIDVTYRRELSFSGRSGELPIDAGSPGRAVRLSKAPSGTLDLFDVTDFRRPRRLAGFTSTPQVSGPDLDLAFPDAGSARLAVASRTTPLRPRSTELDDPPTSFEGATWLRDPSAALDHVIVAHDAFEDAASTLAAARRDSLFGITPRRPGRSRAVRVSDVMDEFAWGMWDPSALRYFLEYAYRYYGGAGADALTYAVFLGDHTYDFRNRLGAGAPDLVPSWEENREDLGTIGFGSVQYASDDPLVRFDGYDDPYLDLAVGRIPVATAAAARAVIEDKIVRAETAPEYGAWRARVLLAADDLCQLGNPDPIGADFITHIELSDANLPPAYDRRKIYLTEYGTSCSIGTKPDAAADFAAAWNEGTWLVNYVGHGDETFLADERLLTLNGVAGLTNASRLPLFIATASKSAKYNLPTQTSITEAIAVSPAGGALAATGSVSNQTFPDAAFALNREFVLGLFVTDLACACPGWARAAGLAFAEAKRAIPAEAAKYVFLGDPASVPPAPRLDRMALSGPASAQRGSTVPVRARLSDLSLSGAELELRSEDARRGPAPGASGYRLPGDLMFRGVAAFTADSLDAAFVVPLAAREGLDARIRGYARGLDGDAVAALTSLSIQGQVDPSTDLVGPDMTFEAHPPQVPVGGTLPAALEDPSGIRLFVSGGAAIELGVRDAGNTEVLTLDVTEAFAYDSGSHTRGVVAVPVPEVERGTYTFVLRASDNFGNASTGSTAVEVTTGAGGLGFLQVYAYPNPFPIEGRGETDVYFTLSGNAEVRARIYAVSGRTVRKELAAEGNRIHWDGRDDAGDPVANGVYLVRLTAQAGGAAADHLERVVVLR